MTNAVRVEEIRKEICSIEMEQEEANRYVRNLQKKEEESYEYLRRTLWNIGQEFEACRGDRHLMRLVEEKYSILQAMDRECGEYLAELQNKQVEYKYKCESDIDELRREMQRLQMEVV